MGRLENRVLFQVMHQTEIRAQKPRRKTENETLTGDQLLGSKLDEPESSDRNCRICVPFDEGVRMALVIPRLMLRFPLKNGAGLGVIREAIKIQERPVYLPEESLVHRAG